MEKRIEIHVVADDRERKSGIIECLSNRLGRHCEVRRLLVGDFLVNDSLVFERKTLKDFAVSIIDGRLFKQAAALVMSKWQPVLILEGTSSDLKPYKFKRESIQGGLIKVSLGWGIPVLRTKNICETADIMVRCAKQLDHVAEGIACRKGTRLKGKVKYQRMMLQSLPGIGNRKAKELLRCLGSVQNVVNASYDELREIHGIGDRLADQIRYSVSEERTRYYTVEKV